MAASLQITVNNNKNKITLCDNYGVEITVKCKTFNGITTESIFTNGVAQALYNAYFSECDSVSIYNKNEYVCALENKINFSDISSIDISKLSKQSTNLKRIENFTQCAL